MLILIMLIFSERLLTSSTDCRAPFPIVIGGSERDTYLNQIEFHAPTDRIVAVGYTYDSGMSTNCEGSPTPYIVVYQGPLMTYLWGVSLELHSD
jgi:hypothetical protein